MRGDKVTQEILKTPYKVYEAFVRKFDHDPGSWSSWDYLGKAGYEVAHRTRTRPVHVNVTSNGAGEGPRTHSTSWRPAYPAHPVWLVPSHPCHPVLGHQQNVHVRDVW